jgi:hypothetical protein
MHLSLLTRFAGRLARRHLFWHLLIPLAGGGLGEVAVASALALRRGEPFGPDEFVSYTLSLFSPERAGLFVGVFVTFAWVLYSHLQKEADIGMRNVGLAILQDSLHGARRFLAVSAIPLREWFEPPTQIYFSTIVAHRLSNASFVHERVLLVFTRSDSLNLGSPLMDEYHARAFIRLHALSGARLGYLERSDIFRLLDRLTVDERKQLGCYLRWQMMLPMKLLRLLPLCYLRGRIRQIASAIIEYEDGRPPCVIQFSKDQNDIGIRRLSGAQAAAFTRLFKLVDEDVFEAPATMTGPPKIRPDRDFTRYYT